VSYRGQGLVLSGLAFQLSASTLGAELCMKPIDFRRFADECLRLARQVEAIDDRAALLSMAQAWIRLADKEPHLQALLDTKNSECS
jgi:hypothetical protein